MLTAGQHAKILERSEQDPRAKRFRSTRFAEHVEKQANLFEMDEDDCLQSNGGESGAGEFV
jgi:hypothetical protein